MVRFALAGFLALAIACPLRADVVPDLLRGEAIVTGRDNIEERSRGIRLALTQVLVKVCGDDRIADHPQLQAVLAEAENHVLAFEYVDRKSGIQISDEQGTRDRSFRLHVDFHRDNVHAILERLGYLPWHEDRPRLLVLLSVTDHESQFMVGTESGKGVGHRETLILDGHRRGLAVVLPKMDRVEAMAISHRDIAEIHGGTLGALALSYTAGALLAGTMTITAQGYWKTDWTLLADGLPLQWHVSDAPFDRAIALGLSQSARVLAGVQ